jgi:hypothetical protein
VDLAGSHDLVWTAIVSCFNPGQSQEEDTVSNMGGQLGQGIAGTGCAVQSGQGPRSHPCYRT